MKKISTSTLQRPMVICLLAAFCCLLWGSAFPAVKIGYGLLSISSADSAEQLIFAGLRFFFAGVVAVLFHSASLRRLRLPARSSLWKATKLGLIQTLVQYALFYIGMAFAYFVVFPLAFGFLTHTAPEGVQVSTDIASYLSFVMALFMAFGVAFEVPVAIVLLCWVGVTTPDDLRKKRPYILVGAFVVGMLLTPPDVFSQTLLAIPMYCLFEVGVFFSRFYVGKGRRSDDEDDTSDKTTEE